MIICCDSKHWLPLSDLVPVDDNLGPRHPRRADRARLDELKRSLSGLSLFKGFLVWRDDDGRPLVIGGNQRYSALSSLVGDGEKLHVRRVSEDGRPGPTEETGGMVPVTWFAGSRPEAMAVAARDNAATGDWDWALVGGWLDAILSESPQMDITLTGFSLEEADDFRNLSSSDVTLNELAGALPDELRALPREPKRKNSSSGEEFRIGSFKTRITASTARALQDAIAAVTQQSGARSTDEAILALLRRSGAAPAPAAGVVPSEPPAVGMESDGDRTLEPPAQKRSRKKG